MNLANLANNPAFPRALVIGLFGGAGLALTALYSRRGPLIYPVWPWLKAELLLSGTVAPGHSGLRSRRSLI